MSDFISISAKLVTYRFLLTQLYANAFIANPESLQAFSESMIEAAKFRSTVGPNTDHEKASEILPSVVAELESFFADVQKRLEN